MYSHVFYIILGVRLPLSVVNRRAWLWNNNTISISVSECLDVPSPFHQLHQYRATLGHKANHSFQPNSKYDHCFHPRFGYIKCIRSVCISKHLTKISVKNCCCRIRIYF